MYEPDFHVMPLASNVDRFFDSYSRYLEALVADPHDAPPGRLGDGQVERQGQEKCGTGGEG